MKPIIITIDGVAASGKGTIAKYIEKQFNFLHIDSGLFYRKITKILIDKKIDIKNMIFSLPNNPRKIGRFCSFSKPLCICHNEFLESDFKIQKYNDYLFITR